MNDQIKRIRYYEEILQDVSRKMKDGIFSDEDTGLDEQIRELELYYGSTEWKQDYAADEAGLLPPDLKRGVLSEDGIYNVLQQYSEWKQKVIRLLPLTPDDREQFILDNQKAFNYGAMEEFGLQDDHFEEDGEIISRKTIESSIDNGEAYRIMQGGQKVGGVVIKTDGARGDLDLLFVSPKVHSKGIGYAAWCEVEKLHPEVKVWETITPYFEKRNIHFYVNRCGFHIVEFFNSYHPDTNDPEMNGHMDDQFSDGMFRFEKRL